MKRVLPFFVVVALISMLFLSCATTVNTSTTEVPVVDTIHVTTFDSFVAAFATAQENPDIKYILFDNDIEWDIQRYAGGDYVFMPVATGLTIDLGGHTLNGVPTNALNFTGDSFTLKNGAILGAKANSRYSVNINYEGTNGLKELALAHVPASYDDSDPVWAKRIIIEDLTASAMLCGYSTMEIKNSRFEGGTYRGLTMQGSSGIVENVFVCTSEEGASAGFVAHSYGVVTLKGNVDLKGKFGVYSAQCSTLKVEEGATVNIGAWGTYGIYLEKQGFTTIGEGVTVQPAPGRETIYTRTGSTLVIEKGAVLKDGDGNILAAPLAAEFINDDGSIGSIDVDWKGANEPSVIQDNR